MRLFTGLAIAPDILDTLRKLLDQLRPLARLNWSPVENLHITTKFIGQWPEERLDEFKLRLREMPAVSVFSIRITGFDFLPDGRRPRVLLARVHAGPELAELARRIEDALAPLGCAREDRPYTPHLTLARIKIEDIRALRESIASMSAPDSGDFEATEFHLYQSRPGTHGSTYTKLASYPLLKAPSRQTAGMPVRQI